MDQKFCVALKAGVPFDLTLGAINPITREMTLIKIDYNNLPIRCRYCLSTAHLVIECEALHNPQRNGHSESIAGTHTRDATSPPRPSTCAPNELQAGAEPRNLLKDPGILDAPEGGQHMPILVHSADSSTSSGYSLRQGQTPQTDLHRAHRRRSEMNGGRGISIDCAKWQTRATRRGRESSPNTNKFSDVNEFCEARNKWNKRQGTMFLPDPLLISHDNWLHSTINRTTSGTPNPHGLVISILEDERDTHAGKKMVTQSTTNNQSVNIDTTFALESRRADPIH